MEIETNKYKDIYFEKMKGMNALYNEKSLEKMYPIVEEIRALKQSKNAVILSHYYMPSEIQVLSKDGGVADYLGDSLGLSLEATKAKADYRSEERRVGREC